MQIEGGSVESAAAQLLGMMDGEGYVESHAPSDEPEGEPTSSQEVEARQGNDEEPEDTPEGEEAPEGEQEDESGEEGEAEEPEDEPQDPPEDQLFDITIDGEDYEVNLEELKTGYLRQEDLIAHRTQLEQEHNQRVTELEAEREQLKQELEYVSVMILGDANSRFQGINWQQLKQQDPDQYAKLRLEALETQERVQALQKRRQDILKYQEQANSVKQQSKLQAEFERAKQLIPEMTTDQEWSAKTVAFGKQLGYTEDEIAAIDDARHLAVLNQARLYSESQVRRKQALDNKVTRDLPQAVKPGAPKPRNAEATQKTKQLRQRLSSERSIDAAAAFLLGNGMV